MTINHHPSDETLLRYAAGTLGAGPALVVGVHLEGCGRCLVRVADFESIGGQILDEMTPGHLAADALARTLEGLDAAMTWPQRKPARAQMRANL